MCYGLMPVSGTPIVSSLVQHVTAENLRNPQVMQQVDDFNNRLQIRLGDTNFVLAGGDIDEYYPNNAYDIPIQGDTENGDANTDKRPEADDIDSYDKIFGATYILDPLKSPDNVATRATVIRRKTDQLGNQLGKSHANPLLDTR